MVMISYLDAVGILKTGFADHRESRLFELFLLTLFPDLVQEYTHGQVRATVRLQT